MGNLAEELLDFTPQCHHLRWLCDHLDGWQFGDQGLIDAITVALKIVFPLRQDAICIEYGAGDGQSLPLTIDRVLARGFGGVLVEIDEARRNSLAAMYPDANVCAAIDWKSFTRSDLAVVVIDIDGQDSFVMRQMLQAGVRPTVLVVEHFDNHFPIGTSASRAIPEWMLGLKLASGHAIQDTAETLHAIATANGYERIGFNRCNSYFVRGDKFLSLMR
jgi:hypothetical protein